MPDERRAAGGAANRRQAGPGQTAPRGGRRARRGQARFLAAAAGILLAGALAAGLAARAVVAPRPGARTAQRTPAIPTVLGQTAEELLFPPWQFYDSLTLGAASPGYREFAAYYFRLLGVQLGQDAPNALSAAMADNLAAGDRVLHTPYCLFLHDYPALLEGGEPVLLQYAEMSENSFSLSSYGRYSVSFLVEPASPRALTEDEQAAALERVKRDLKRYLMLGETADFAPLLSHLVGADSYYVDELETYFEGEGVPVDENGRAAYPGEGELLAPINDEVSTDLALCSPFDLGNLIRNLGGYIAVGRDFARAISPNGDPEALSIEDFIDAQNDYHTYTAQLISTPTQVVVLLGLDTLQVGIYYDIQLGRYSGVGAFWS